MQIHAKAWSVSSLPGLNPKINPQPQYQRGEVWKVPRKQKLIDSLLRGFDVPKFYLRKRSSPVPYLYEVVDGQQRLSAINGFLDGDFRLGPESSQVPFGDFGDLSGLRIDELPVDARLRFDTYQLSIIEISEATEEEIREQFLRLQEGMALIQPEKRNAMLGAMRDFVAYLAATHRVFPRTSLESGRYGWDDIVAHVVRLELAQGPADIKATDLKRMYEVEQHFSPDGAAAKKIKKTLNYLGRVCKPSLPEMDIKWGFVDMYLLLSYLLEGYDLQDRHHDFRDFYIDFELTGANHPARRPNLKNPAILLEGTPSPWERDLYDYIAAFQREGARKENVKTRHEVYVRRALDFMPDLVPLDPKRAYTRDERLVIYRRDDGVCQECKKPVSFPDSQADHHVPFARGGRTTIENGRTTHAGCNQKKGASPA